MWPSLIVLLALIGVIGDAFIKESGSGSIWSVKFFVGLIIYSLTAFGWFFAMKHVKLGSLGAIYGVATVLLLVLVGVVLFKEQLNIGEYVGIFLAILSILLLAKFS